MTLNRNHFIAAPQREALVSLTALCYIEEHQLLTRQQLEDAKKSLQALFLRTSGEETTLRQLIEVLKSTRNIHRSFTSIAGIITGVTRCVTTVGERIAALREQINAQAPDDGKVSFNDLILKAAALALREFPNLNASLEGEQLVDHPNIDVNVAVAIEGGLIAPFVPDADQKGLIAIARMTKDLVGRARNGGLTPDEYQGGTFTISNLGMFDVEEFIAIINPPQAAILAVGSIKDVPVVEDGEITPGKRMNLTLSADHRVTDGAEVARFLQAVKRYLEKPLTIAFG